MLTNIAEFTFGSVEKVTVVLIEGISKGFVQVIAIRTSQKYIEVGSEW